MPEHVPLLARVVEPHLREVFGIQSWECGIISSKKFTQFEIDDLVFKALRRSKLRGVKDVRDAFKEQNKWTLQAEQRQFIDEMLRFHRVSTIAMRLAEGKDTFIATFTQKKANAYDMKVSKMDQVKTSSAAYRARCATQ